MQYFFPKEVIVQQRGLWGLPVLLHEKGWEKIGIVYSESALSKHLDQLLQTFPTAEFFKMPKGEPTVSMVDLCMETFSANIDAFIAIGGGSTIDLVKVVAAKLKDATLTLTAINERAFIEKVPIVAIPTTAGTGSEATKITVILDERTNTKYNPAHIDLIPEVVLLDSALMKELPKKIAAFTALDALTHAIEAYVSTKASTLNDSFCLRAIGLITPQLEKIAAEQLSLDDREKLLIGSYFAGIAISNASTNLAHATGRALGAEFKLSHGQSVALMHPFVVQYSLQSAKKRYDDIAIQMGLNSAEQLSGYLIDLNERLGVFESCAFEQKLTPKKITSLAQKALQGNGILTNREVPSETAIIEIFQALKQQLQIKGGIQTW